MVKKPTAKLSKVKANPVFVLVAADISHQGKTADLCCSENNQ